MALLGLDSIVLGSLMRGTKLSTASVLAEVSDKADKDVELGSNGLGASLRGQLMELRDEQLR